MNNGKLKIENEADSSQGNSPLSIFHSQLKKGYKQTEVGLTLFKSLCRHYYDIDPSAAAGYVNAYREMWDTETNGKLIMENGKLRINENPYPGNAEPQLGFGDKEEKEAKLGLGDPRGGAPGHELWYSRGYLPHYDSFRKLQSITFRLADSLPQSKLHQLELEIESCPESVREAERRKRIEHWLDAGMGSCALKHPQVAGVVQDTLLKFDGTRYRLIAWCIMPNHVHVLIEPKEELARILQSWKSYTGRWAMANSAELGLSVPREGHFWMREYWDRYIRDEKHFRNVVDYIQANPVKAGLCREPQDWPWSSSSVSLGTPRPTSALEEEERAKLGLGAPGVGDPRQELLTGRIGLI